MTTERSASAYWGAPENVEFFSNKAPSNYVIHMLNLLKLAGCALDHGCGGGRHSYLLAERGYNTFAIDENPKMVRMTRKKLAKFYSVEDLQSRVLNCSILSLPFENESINLIVSTGVFHQVCSVKDYEKAVLEAHRVLAKGGALITEVFTSDHLDPTFTINKSDKHIVTTKDNLAMTLLPAVEYVDLIVKRGFTQHPHMLAETKTIETGPRFIYRTTFIKNG